MTLVITRHVLTGQASPATTNFGSWTTVVWSIIPIKVTHEGQWFRIKICHLWNLTFTKLMIRDTIVWYTVKPVYNGHSREKQKVAVVGRCPLYKGLKQFQNIFHLEVIFKNIQTKDCYDNNKKPYISRNPPRTKQHKDVCKAYDYTTMSDCLRVSR